MSEFSNQYNAVLHKFPSTSSVGELATLCRNHGVPKALRCDIWRYLLSPSSADSTWRPKSSSSSPQPTTPPPQQAHQQQDQQPQNFVNSPRSDTPNSIQQHPMLSEAIALGFVNASSADISELSGRVFRVCTCLRSSLLPSSTSTATNPSPWPSNWLVSIVVPFISIDMSEGDAFNCCFSLLTACLPQTLSSSTSATTSAEGMLELLRLLVYYYDPILAFHLDQRGANPKIYALSWFSTLFASSSTLPCILKLWDWYFCQRDPLLLLPVALAIILDSREALISITERTSLIEHLTKVLALESDGQVDRVTNRALAINSHLPTSFKKQLHATVHNPMQFRVWIHTFISGSVCMHVSASDVFREKQRGRPIFLIDTRNEQEINQNGGLPTAFPLPAMMLLENPKEFETALTSIRSLQDDTPTLHYVLCGSGAHGPNDSGSADLSTVSLRMLRSGFRHVSVIHQGFESVHSLAINGKIELSGHLINSCSVCKHTQREKEEQESSLTSTAIAKTFKSIVDSTSEKLQQVASQISQQQQQQQQQQTPKTNQNQKHSPFDIFKQHASAAFSTVRSAIESIPQKSEQQPQPHQTQITTNVQKPNQKNNQKQQINEEAVHGHVVSIPSEEIPKPEEKKSTTATTTTNIGTIVQMNSETPKPKEVQQQQQKEEEETKTTTTTTTEGVFTIDDDDDDDEEKEEEEENKTTEEKPTEEKPKKKEEEKNDGYKRMHDWVGEHDSVWEITPLDVSGKPLQQQGFLVVTDNELVFLEKSNEDPTKAKMRSVHTYQTVAKVVFRKSNPKHTIVRFMDEKTQAEQFLVNDSAELIKVVKEHVEKSTSSSN